MRAAAARAWQSRPSVTGVALLVAVVAPASAHAVDLFPVDDWLGAGIKKSAEVVLRPAEVRAPSRSRGCW